MQHICRTCQDALDALNDDQLADFLDEFVSELYVVNEEPVVVEQDELENHNLEFHSQKQ